MSGSASEREVVQLCIDRALEDLPAMPGIIIRVLEETEKAEPSAATLESIICSDQAIVSKVLRVVNSAYYGVQGRVASVGQAIVILGAQQVRNLVLSAAAMSAIPRKHPEEAEALKSFWTHSFATGAAAQAIARWKDLSAVDSETVFVGGLLHDVGRLFMLTHFPSVYRKALESASKAGGGLEDFEGKLFGARHPEIGALVAARWNLPAHLVRIVRDHEGPLAADTPVPVVVVHAADVIAKGMFNESVARLTFDMDPVALDWMGFSHEDLKQVRGEAIERLEEATGAFGLLSAA